MFFVLDRLNKMSVGGFTIKEPAEKCARARNAKCDSKELDKPIGQRRFIVIEIGEEEKE